VTLLVSVAALALPALDMKLKSTGEEDLPRSIPVMQAYDRLTTAFPGEGATQLVAVRAEPGQAEQVLRARTDPLFAPVDAPVTRVSADHRVTTMAIPTPHAADTEDGKRSLTALRDALVPATVGTVSGVEHAVGGDIAQNTDCTANLADRMPLVIGFVLLLTFLIMAVTFRPLVVALTALL
jgi:RND superfamily putative drug exporter